MPCTEAHFHESRTQIMSPIRAITSLACCLSLAACWGGANIGGALSGLPSGSSVTLQNNGADNLTLSANGSFWFVNTVAAAGAYSVTVLTQPAGVTCTVANGSGTVNANEDDVNSVLVTCAVTASVTGTVNGLLAGNTLTLNNGAAVLPLTSNGSFAFPGVAAAGTTYNVTVGTPPSGQTCTVAGGSGTIVTGTPTAITVSCT
jgi:hypothetical protein